MYLRKEQGYELWPQGIHPAGCDCDKTVGFHVRNEDGSENYHLDSFTEAEDKFVELTGGKKFELGHTNWQDGQVL